MKQNSLSPYQGEGAIVTAGADEVKLCSTPAPLDQNVSRGTFCNFTGWNIFLAIIIFIAAINSLVAIIQIWMQKSVGLTWLRESIISPAIPGVAKVMFHGEHYIRAYGLFPHPNILGGFLLMSIVLSLLWLKLFHACPVEVGLFHVEQSNFLRGGTFFTKLRDIFNSSRQNLHQYRFAAKSIYVILAIQIIALVLTFSKSAILGFAIALVYIYVPHLPSWTRMFHVEQKSPSPYQGEGATATTGADEVKDVPRGTYGIFTGWNNSKVRIAILSILIVLSLAVVIGQDLKRNLNQSFEERMVYLNVSRGTILAHPVIGTGIGQFVWNMGKYSPVPLEAWQFQPVHNVFLLIWSELGIVGLGIFIYWLYMVFTTNTILRNNNYYSSISIPLYYFKGILLGFLLIMLFDHYFWDIQQGSLMLWMVMGFIAGLIQIKK